MARQDVKRQTIDNQKSTQPRPDDDHADDDSYEFWAERLRI